MALLREIEDFLRVSGMPATTFGRDAVSDPRFVFDLRKGRTPSERMERRVRRYIADTRVAGTTAADIVGLA